MKLTKIAKLSKFDLLALFGIFLLCVLSVGRIINYYFFYDDFFLFYALQFPNDKNSIFQSPDAPAYQFLQPFFSPQFSIFGYNPTGYFIISFLLFFVTIIVFYFFLKSLTNGDKKLPFFASIIIASGYIGVEAFTWNMGAGPNNTVFLTSSFLSLLFALLYLRQKKPIFLFGIFLTFTFVVYFFQFRAFLLFAWMFLFLVAWFIMKRNIPKYFILFLIFLILFGLIIYRDSFGFNQGQGTHIEFDLLRFSQIYSRNIGNVFFPSELLQLVSERNNIPLNRLELLGGLAGLALLLGAPLWAFLKKIREFPLIFFFSTSVVISLLLIHIVVSLTVNAPDVWYSSHRFYVVILPFLAGFLGSLLVILQKRLNNLATFLLGFWVVTHITLSNIAIQARWDNPISHIQYFYKTIHQYVPKLDRNSVLLIEQGEPTPVSIFVSARAANAYAGLAGFYGIRVDELNLSRSPEEAATMLNNLRLSEEHLYTLYYRRGELLDLTNETRKILNSGMSRLLGSKTGDFVEFSNLNLPASAPLYVSLKLLAIPDFSNLGALKKIDQVQIENSEKYFPLLLEQEKLREKMKGLSLDNPLSFEHEASNVTDGLYSTTWIPLEWGKDGVSATADLGVTRRINRVVWSSSRTASWYVRLPAQYKVEVSLDGKNFTEVNSASNAPILKTGDFFIDEFPEQEVKFINITIFKTHGGLTPSIDEIEVFNKDDGNINFTEYFIFKQNPERYFQDILAARKYLSEFLGNSIALEFGWRVDNNGEYPVGQSSIVSVNTDSLQNIRILLPIIGKEVKSLRIKPINFPAKIYIEDLKIIYPTLDELSKRE